jgi:hypothetical protein
MAFDRDTVRLGPDVDTVVFKAEVKLGGLTV